MSSSVANGIRSPRQIRNWPRLAAGVVMLAMSGCGVSGARSGPYAPVRIADPQECVPFAFGQPSLFACPGSKVYMARQFQKVPGPAHGA
jgi:hypothetical protein